MTLSKAQKDIQRLFDADTRDRASTRLRKLGARERWEIITPKDHVRMERLQRILKTRPQLRGVDYYRAGIIFQHNATPRALVQAEAMAKSGARAGHAGAQWLYAAAVDRARVVANKPQRYGTQIFQDVSGKWKLYPVAGKVSDADRRRHNVMPLLKIESMVELKNTESGARRLRSRKLGLTRIR